MDSITIPILPAGLWVLASAFTLVIMLITFYFYVYQRRRQKAFFKDARDAAELASQKQLLQADVAELRNWIKEQETELERLVAEREEQERLRGELSHLEQECARKEQENLQLRKEVGELENQRHILRKELAYLENEIRQNEEKKHEVEKIVAELDVKKANLDGLKDEIKKEEQKLYDVFHQIAKNQAYLLELREEQKSKQEQLEKVGKELNEVKAKLECIRTQQEEADQLLKQVNKEIAQKQDELEWYKKKIDELNLNKDEIENIISQRNELKERLKNKLLELKEQYNDKQQKLDKIDIEIEEVSNQLEDIKTQQKEANQLLKQLNEEIAQKQDELEKYKKETEEARDYKEKIENIIGQKQAEQARLDIELRELQDYRHALKRDIKEMEKRLDSLNNHHDDQEDLTPFKDLLEIPPQCLSIREFPDGPIDSDEDEVNLLYDFQSKLKSEGIYFSDRVIKAFHTSLKCQSINPLTVLAGVSGTGKTLLPIKYAMMLGIHSLIIPVQPRWDSPQDLFGFYNYLEKRYKATELSRALIRMDEYNYNDSPFDEIPDFRQARDRMLLVLLDEMNLARTEYYFSEFLSKLEIRRLVAKPSDRVERESAELIIDTGTGYAKPFRVWVGQNVLFVGTMNEDETTQTLSDKVLDRANVLRFGKPDESTRFVKNDNKISASSRYLTADIWKFWIKSFDKNAPWNDDVSKWIKKLNSALEKVGRPFGFRVEEAINTYIVNYPGVNKDNYKVPFADQLEQKIIPKLRGLDINDSSTHYVIETIKEIVDEVNDTALGEAFEKSIDNSRATVMFQWSGVTRKADF